MVQLVGPEGDVEWVNMDSVQRKRRNKIKKHKYKKRRKVSFFLMLGIERIYTEKLADDAGTKGAEEEVG
jgi:hypothetical protein